ncbi:hypothetical protein KIPB_003588 [Kipferlia bialata]|uniref:Uncharacterized protein n=1 Tax=Kipferlia bialata TaxID=797122 RepID=A0A391NK58_9EUKA|nr:hypothetical protein KIPB_003588 [Kipferlia bialata]|eukprot:g3588.t1
MIHDLQLAMCDCKCSPDSTGFLPSVPSVPVSQGESDYGDYSRRESPSRGQDMFTEEDGMYQTGHGDWVYAMRGEMEDFTACSSQCGYCGRCSY